MFHSNRSICQMKYIFIVHTLMLLEQLSAEVAQWKNNRLLILI